MIDRIVLRVLGALGWAVFLLLILVVVADLASAQPDAAQPRLPCHDAGEIHKQLSRKYAEAPVAFGLQTNGNLLQIYASKDTGTWTVISTSPAGVSCIVAAGKSWEQLPAQPEGPLA